MAHSSDENTKDQKPFKLSTIDISCFLDDNNESCAVQQQKVIDQIVHSFSTCGFLCIKGHGISSSLLRNMFDISHQFFTTTSKNEQNKCVIRSSVPRGFVGLNSENFASLIGELKPNDMNCKFRIGPEWHTQCDINDKDQNQNKNKINTIKIDINKATSKDSKNEYYNSKQARTLLYPNIWPNTNDKQFNDQFKTVYLSCMDEFYRVSKILFQIFEKIFVYINKDECKELESETKSNMNEVNFASLFDKHTSILASNYYPNKYDICKEMNIKIEDLNKSQLFGIEEHCDIDIFTIIAQNNDCGGLEIKIKKDKDNYNSIHKHNTKTDDDNENKENDERTDYHWVKIPSDNLQSEKTKDDCDLDDLSLIVNVGDGLEYWTNGAWKSTKHRVLIPNGENESRQVIGFFAALNYDAKMQQLFVKSDKNSGNKDNSSDQCKNEQLYKELSYFQWRKQRIKRVVKQLRKLKQKNTSGNSK